MTDGMFFMQPRCPKCNSTCMSSEVATTKVRAEDPVAGNFDVSLLVLHCLDCCTRTLTGCGLVSHHCDLSLLEASRSLSQLQSELLSCTDIDEPVFTAYSGGWGRVIEVCK